jgi:excisionase family DNA binding protein
MQDSEKLLTSREVSTRLGICPKTLQRLRKRGAISFVMVGGAFRYRPSVLDYFINSRTVGKRGTA